MKNFISTAIDSLTPSEIEELAIESGFQKRMPKKISSVDLLNLYCLEAIDKALSYNDIAGVLHDSTGTRPSRQAVWKRANTQFSNFLQMILGRVIENKIIVKNELSCEQNNFPRVLVQDSTVLKLPDRLFDSFSGVSNSHKSVCNARIQGVYDLIAKQFVTFSIDKYSKNDFDAASELCIEPGDLVLRDRGYLKCSEIKRLNDNCTLYIYRHKSLMVLRNPVNDQKIDILKLLKKKRKIDMNVCLNDDHRTMVRLIAVPVREEIANIRRMKAKKQTRGHKPSEKMLSLMSWTIFITNLPVVKYDFDIICTLYGLRWRIEIIFKTWKSNMAFSIIHNVSCHQLHALIIARLITIVITMHCIYRKCEELVYIFSKKRLSLSKLMRYIRAKKERLQHIIIQIEKDIDRVVQTLTCYCTYDKRKRLNYVENKELILLHIS